MPRPRFVVLATLVVIGTGVAAGLAAYVAWGVRVSFQAGDVIFYTGEAPYRGSLITMDATTDPVVVGVDLPGIYLRHIQYNGVIVFTLNVHAAYVAVAALILIGVGSMAATVWARRRTQSRSELPRPAA